MQKIIGKAVKRLNKHGVKLKREQWLREAVNAEQGDSIVTCRSIIKETMHYGLEDYVEEYADEKEKLKQVRRIWIENGDDCLKQGAIETARALYYNALFEFPKKKSLWFSAI